MILFGIESEHKLAACFGSGCIQIVVTGLIYYLSPSLSIIYLFFNLACIVYVNCFCLENRCFRTVM